MNAVDASEADQQLVRAIGVPGLAANIVNTTIGASIFVLPALIARNLGSAAPIAFILCAIAMALFVTCFALAGSRVSLTGGPYAYIEVAFGRYLGFLAGVIYFVMALLSVAAVTSVLVGAIVAIVPLLAGSAARLVLTFSIYAFLALLNVRGVRSGTRAVAITTTAKLIPLFVFIAVGVFFLKPAALTLSAWPDTKSLGDSVLLLMFAFFGVEIALVPSGEVRNPARTVPRAIFIALITITIVYFSFSSSPKEHWARDWRKNQHAAGRSCRHFSRQFRSPHAPGGSNDFFLRLCHQQYFKFASNSFCARTRWHSAASARARSPTLPFA